MLTTRGRKMQRKRPCDQRSTRQMVSVINDKSSSEAALRKRQHSEKLQASSIKRRTVEVEPIPKNSMHRLSVSVPIMNRSGKIIRIILKNFMCHGSLTIDFNNNVNLVIGNKISGKAVLTALTVGLGSETSQFTDITQLIKRGETRCSVEIHLANNCDPGYNRETYGHEIVVLRTFSVDGTCTYRIKNESGQLISNKQKDLMELRSCLNIRVDPLCVLSQETLKAFVRESDPKQLFQLFIKATQIDTVIEKLNRCSTQCSTVKKQLDDQKTLTANLKKEISEGQSKFNSLQSISYIEETLNAYKLESAWLKVRNEESILKEISITSNKYQEIRANIIQSINTKENSIASRRAECDILHQQMSQLKIDRQGNVQQKDQMEQNMSKDKEAFNDINEKIKQVDLKIERNMKNIDQLENDMSESRTESSECEMSRTALKKRADDEKLQNLFQRKVSIEFAKDTVSRGIEMTKKAIVTSEAKLSHFRHQRTIHLNNKERIRVQIGLWSPVEAPGIFLHAIERKEYLIDKLRDAESRLFEIDEKISVEEEKRNDLSRSILENVRIKDKIDDDICIITQAINDIEKVKYADEYERDMHRKKLEDLKRYHNELNQERLSLKQQLDNVTSAIGVNENGMKKIDESLMETNGKIIEKLQQISSETNLATSEYENTKEYRKIVAMLTNNLEKLKGDYQHVSDKISALRLSASKLGERIKRSISYEVLLAKIKETKQMLINNVSESADSMKNIQQMLQHKTTEYEEKQKLVEDLDKTLLQLCHSQNNQYQWLMRFRSHISLRVQHEYNRIMKLHNYDGISTIDYQNEILELSVVPCDKHITAAVSSENSLSGDERSFSTVAFLFALWSVIDSPFYFLDESGVSLDENCRYYLKKLFLDEAKKSPHRQYTFITSEDIAAVMANDDIAIQRLADPV